LRREEERAEMLRVLEAQCKGSLDLASLYNPSSSWSTLETVQRMLDQGEGIRHGLGPIALTNSLRRLFCLVEKCLANKEPMLLIGETGCGKTTVCQLFSILWGRPLHILNCHQHTETQDFLGGLRPVRGREQLRTEIQTKMEEFLRICFIETGIQLSLPVHANDTDLLSIIDSAWVSVQPNGENGVDGEGSTSSDRDVESETESQSNQWHAAKKRKRVVEAKTQTFTHITSLRKELCQLINRHQALFEWQDGPLVTAMKEGHIFLLDELSLAEDAVIERLNSVLEPERMLLLAEKGDGSMDEIRAHPNFCILGTMNPGGDFGKHELSPALRSRFTEIWVPAIRSRADFEVVISQLLGTSLEYFIEPILDFVAFFEKKCIGAILSIRDVLSWVYFIREAVQSEQAVDPWVAFLHGASMVFLDGVGLGMGLSNEDVRRTQSTAQEFLLSLVPVERRTELQAKLSTAEPAVLTETGQFGIAPFFIPLGPVPLPDHQQFWMEAPTTAANLRRVLRALQLPKAVLLEGSPGVGKTSLIAALAKASGHELVRINLSEQTDISDLMGSDLPIADEVLADEKNSEQCSGGDARFAWCDGVFLRALKAGNWVLLMS